MIIASDLDRTLIYSNRAIDEFGRPLDSNLIPIESREGKSVSFMTEASYKALAAISSEHLFVPITTRTADQYKRIFIFQQELTPHYAITSNGARILHDGEEMPEWSAILTDKMKHETAAIGEIIAFLQKEEVLFDNMRKQIEDLFFYFILKSPLAMSDKHALSSLLAPYGWIVSLQGRKLYFIPKTINKGDALQFVCSYSGAKVVAGSGDSILDLDFLKYCRYRFVPKHGELISDSNHVFKDFFITKNHGILAGEEILNQFLLLLKIN